MNSWGRRPNSTAILYVWLWTESPPLFLCLLSSPRSVFTCAPPTSSFPPRCWNIHSCVQLSSTCTGRAKNLGILFEISRSLRKSKGKKIALHADAFVELSRIRGLSCGTYGKHCWFLGLVSFAKYTRLWITSFDLLLVSWWLTNCVIY